MKTLRWILALVLVLVALVVIGGETYDYFTTGHGEVVPPPGSGYQE